MVIQKDNIIDTPVTLIMREDQANNTGRRIIVTTILTLQRI